MDERYPRIPQKLMEPPQNLKIPPYFGIYLSLLWIFGALCRSPHLSPSVLSSVCLGIAASFSKHHNYNAHVVAAPINVATLSSSVYQLGVVFLKSLFYKRYSLTGINLMKRVSNIVWFFHFFQLHLFVLSARKCFVLRTNQGNLVNFLWISFLQMNQYVWFASEYIFASLHKGVYFVSVRCFLCTVQIYFIESKSER